jgi:uncharacterized membrane protein
LLVLTGSGLLLSFHDVASVPVDYPVTLSGGYAQEIEDTGIYVDHLQPLANENYLIRFENRDNFQVRYRLDLSGVPTGWTVFLESGGRSAVVDLDPLATRSMYIYIKNPTVGTHDILLNTTREGSSDYWNIVLRLMVQRGPLIVEAVGTTFTVGRTTPVELDVRLTNVGTTPLNISLSMDRMVLSDRAVEGSWTYDFKPRGLIIPGGQNRTVRGTVRSSETEKLGAQYISSVIASIEGISRPFTSAQLNFRVSTIYNLKVSVSPPGYQKIAPGSSFQFSIELYNLADDTDYVIIGEYEKPTDWSIGWNDTIDPTSLAVSISTETSRVFHPVVFTSPTAIAGKHMVVLRAKGTGNLTDILLPIEIARKDSFEMKSILPPGSADTYRLFTGPNTFEVSLRNLGNYYDTATVEVLSAPSFATVRPVHVRIGAGSQNVETAGSGTLNLSGSNDHEFDIDPWSGPLRLSFSPGQTAALGVLATDIDPSTDAVSGKLVLKYTFGVFSSSKVLELELKVILSDVEVISTDPDSIPDLLVHPDPDLKVGDRVHFTFSVKNNYPLPTSGLEWSIVLSGTVLIKGDLGEIQPGETKDFNVSWKANKPTKYSNPAIVRITGRGYTDVNTAPSAKTDEPLFIEPGSRSPSWGLVILFAGFMSVMIVGLIVAWMVVQSRLREREEEERRDYESLYGPRKRPALGTSRNERGKGLAPSRERALPSARPKGGRSQKGSMADRRKGHRGPPGKRERAYDGPKKKEGRPRAQKGEGPAPSGLEDRSDISEERSEPSEAAEERSVEDLSELYEVEELEE